MNRFKAIRLLVWSALLLVGGMLFYSTTQWQAAQSKGQNLVQLGGPFKLVSDQGTVITDETVNTKPHMIFFGYTHCPHVCPTTLYEATGWLQALGSDADKLGFYFITVDPERDTQGVISDYVKAFDPRIRGLTGETAALEKMLKSYAVYFKKVPDADDPEDYTMDHSASIYLMRKGGKFLGTIAYGESKDVAIDKIKRLLAKS